MEIVIKVENISKRYQIGVRQDYYTLRDAFDKLLKPRNFIKGFNNREESFWALKDVSFEVMPGEVLGIIGANGSGKSTLLKVLSRITLPTTGRAIIRGKVGSLLEVGTGFSPELTGRENIFLNGAILGMSQKEVRRKFDEIIAFSGVEKFIDTPVKHYSSGMYVRLAFSVAAHLETEILIVDEVLAVGDIEFQKKSMGKMHDATKEGRTVLFVSHNMEAIQNLCNQAILLEHGKVVKISSNVSDLTTEYSNSLYCKILDEKQIQRRGDGSVKFVKIKLLSIFGQNIDNIVEGEPFILQMTLKAARKILPNILSVTFVDGEGREIMTSFASDNLKIVTLNKGENVFSLRINPNPFVPGSTISLRLACLGSNNFEYDHVLGGYIFPVIQNGSLADNYLSRIGIVNIPVLWKKVE